MIKVNGTQIVPTLFPDNTSQVWKLSDEIIQASEYNVEWIFEHEGEFLHLAQLKDLLDNYNSTHGEINLYLPYLPYGRQDKGIGNEQTFALQSFSRLLNKLSFTNIIIMDPHSDKAIKWIDDSQAKYPAFTLAVIHKLTETDLVLYPDKGALNKYMSIYDFDFIYANKERDPETGKILKQDIVACPQNKSVLIVDDICDGGATFEGLAKQLVQSNNKVNLFTTHGIFSKGLKGLHAVGINRIFTLKGEAFEDHDGNILYKEVQ